jgi:hypothetical protein
MPFFIFIIDPKVLNLLNLIKKNNEKLIQRRVIK